MRTFHLLIVLSLVHTAAAGDWPQFLGPQRNGISAEAGLIDSFPAAGPPVLWRCPLGVGMSGVAIAGDIACTMFQDDARQYVVALNARTGEIVWKSPIAPAYENAMGNGPRATPTIVEDAVYAMSGEGIVACYSLADGRKQWSIDPCAEIGGSPAEYGMACSPLVNDGRVFVTVGLPKATLIALDCTTGKIVWRSGTGNPAGYSSPALLPIHGKPQLVAFHGSGAFGLDPATGKEFWNYAYETDYNCNIATPILVDGNVLISSGENHGTALLKLPGDTSGTVSEIWSSFGAESVLRNEWQTSILLDGHLYGFDNVGSAGPVTNLNCVNAKTGELVWRQRRFGKGNLIAADGKLWCSTMAGELVLVRATPEKFTELARASLIGKTRQAPSLSAGRLYLRDDAEVVCVYVRKKN